MANKFKTQTLILSNQIVTSTGNSLYVNGIAVGGGGGGEANTASNLGNGSGIFSSKVGVDLQLKSLVPGSGVGISGDGSSLSIYEKPIPRSFSFSTTTNTFTNLAAALTEQAAFPRMYIDFTNAHEIHMTAYVSTTGTPTSIIGLQYSLNESSWTGLNSNYLNIGAPVVAGTRRTNWEPVPSGAKKEVIVRCFTSGGNGTADPVVKGIYLQVR